MVVQDHKFGGKFTPEQQAAKFLGGLTPDQEAAQFLSGLSAEEEAAAFLKDLPAAPPPEPTLGDKLLGIPAGLARGFQQAVGGSWAAVETLGNRLRPDLAAEKTARMGMSPDQWAELVQRFAAEQPARDFPVTPGLEGSLWTSLPEGLGQAGFYGLTGAATGGLGLTGAAGTAVTAAAIGGQGALAQFSGGYYDALANGADPEVAFEAGLANAPGGLIEGIPLGGQVARVLGRVNKASGGQLGQIITRALVEGAEGGGQEMTQRLWADVVAKHVAAYDEDRKILEDAWKQDALPGFLVSALLSGTSQAFQGKAGVAETAPPTSSESKQGVPTQVQEVQVPEWARAVTESPAGVQEAAPAQAVQEPTGTPQATPALPVEDPAKSQPGASQGAAPVPVTDPAAPPPRDPATYTKERAQADMDETGSLPEWDYLYHVAPARQEGGLKAKPWQSEGSPVVWLNPERPHAGMEGHVYAVDPSKVSKAKLRAAKNTDRYSVHEGDIPPEALIYLGEVKDAREPFNVRKAFVEAAVRKGRTVPPEVLAEHGIQAQPGETQSNVGTPETVAPPQADPTPLPAEPKALQEEVEKRITGLRNEISERERGEMGMSEREAPLPRSWESLNTQAADRLAKDPDAGRHLVQSLSDEPRSVSDLESAVLLRERTRLRMLRDELETQIVEANRAGDMGLVTELENRIKRVQDEYATTIRVSESTGSELARAFKFRQAESKQDYSLASMERRMSVAANRGGPLTQEQQAQVRDLHARLQAAEAKLEAYEVERTKMKAEIKRKDEVRALKREVRARQSEASKKRIDDLFKELKAVTSSTASAGIPLDPKVLRIVKDLAVEHVKLGYTEFAMWADEMISKAGEQARPYLEDAWKEAQGVDSVQLAQKRANARKRAEINRLQEKIDKGDFTKQERAEIPLDDEGIKLKAEVERLRREFQRGVERARLKNRTGTEKRKDIAREIFDLPRAIMSSMDVSAPGRQGMFLLSSSPVIGGRAMKQMFQALRSEQKAMEIEVMLRDLPHADLAQKAGLDLTTDETLSADEEAIRSRISDRIPGIPMSNRAFRTFLNSIRAQKFEQMVNAMPAEPTLDEAKALANFVNIASGRGNLGRESGKLAEAVRAASFVLWSPRLLLSRFQLLLGHPLYRGTANTRKLIAKEYAKSLVGYLALRSLLVLAGVQAWEEAEEDVSGFLDRSLSSDWGKVVIGDTRIDSLAGLSQVTVLLSRLAQGKSATLSGKVKDIRGDVPYGQDDAFDTTMRFLRTKFSPTAGAFFDVLSGKDVIGRPVTAGGLAKNLLVPLSFQDVLDVMEEQGVPKGTALSLLSMFGWSVSSYDVARR